MSFARVVFLYGTGAWFCYSVACHGVTDHGSLAIVLWNYELGSVLPRFSFLSSTSFFLPSAVRASFGALALG